MIEREKALIAQIIEYQKLEDALAGSENVPPDEIAPDLSPHPLLPIQIECIWLRIQEYLIEDSISAFDALHLALLSVRQFIHEDIANPPAVEMFLDKVVQIVPEGEITHEGLTPEVLRERIERLGIDLPLYQAALHSTTN